MGCYGNQFFYNTGMVARVAKSCHVWLSVSPDRMETLQVLQLPRVFTTDYEETRVHVVLTNQITSKQYGVYLHWHHMISIP